MGEIRHATGVNALLVERLVKIHFGPECTSRLAYDVIRGRYVASEAPRRLAVPQRLFGIRLWWRTIGEFSNNLGCRLELWRPEYLRHAEAFVADHNSQSQGPRIELYPAWTSPAASPNPAPA
jgi:hypothetical protein